MNNHKKTVIIIAGPTASGKTSLAVKLAAHFNTEIISADSRQCYKELNIGVAKPTAEELDKIKHHFISSHSIHENVTAQTFEQYALNAANEIFTKNNTAVMAGGTGLYIKAFCEGLDDIPAVDETVRRMIVDNYNSQGLQWLQDEVKNKDPEFWNIAEQQNPQRLMRSLEVLLSTGNSITIYRKKEMVQRPFNIIKIGIDISKEQLHQNINTRVDEMMRNGLTEEVKLILPFKNLNALFTVGYRELFEYFEGTCTLDKAVSNIKINTRHYAKRQMTWFRKDENICWFSNTDFDAVLEEILLLPEMKD